MDFYRLHVLQGIDPPEEWSRVLVPFSGVSRLRLVEEFKNDCIIECGPLLIKQIHEELEKYVEILPYIPGEQERLRRHSQKEQEEDNALW